MNFFDYIPYLVRLSNHQDEIAELKTLLTPTLAEFNKVKSKAIPLIVKLYHGVIEGE